jgi:hypothetical protein
MNKYINQQVPNVVNTKSRRKRERERESKKESDREREKERDRKRKRKRERERDNSDTESGQFHMSIRNPLDYNKCSELVQHYPFISSIDGLPQV